MSNSDIRNGIEEEFDPIRNQDRVLYLPQNQDGVLKVQQHSTIICSCGKSYVILIVVPGRLV